MWTLSLRMTTRALGRVQSQATMRDACYVGMTELLML
jgi:hypothetical protein